MSLADLKVDWKLLVEFLFGPGITILAWFIVDRILIMLHKRGKITERLFTRHASSETQRHVIEQRVRTFRGIFLQTIRLLNGLFFFFLFLGHFKIDPKPLLAGIGVAGLGVSLAAQNILRDFINGLFIVMEDQFNVGDWVDIGTFSGTVENFTMRVTRLRTDDGRLVIIPNGTIAQVVNSNKQYSMTIVKVGVSYDTDVAKAMRILDRCGSALKGLYPYTVLDRPIVHGIVDFRDNDILLRMLIKTLPGEHWNAGRHLRRIIKEQFDQEGIEIPFPQRVIHTAPYVPPVPKPDEGEEPAKEISESDADDSK